MLSNMMGSTTLIREETVLVSVKKNSPFAFSRLNFIQRPQKFNMKEVMGGEE